MCQYLFDGHSLPWVEPHNTPNKVCYFRFQFAQGTLHRALSLGLHLCLRYHRLGQVAVERTNVIVRRVSDKLYDFLQLLKGRASVEKGPAEVYFKDYTAKAPYVCWVLIGLASKQHFRCSIPPRGHSLSHHTVAFLPSSDTPHQSKITQLYETVAIEQYIGRLEIPVYKFGTVQILQSFGNLIDDVFIVHLLENTLAYDVMQICLHILKYEIDILTIICFDGFLELDDVVVIQLLEYADFPVCALCVSAVLEGIEDLLQGQHLFVRAILHFPDVAVGATTDLLDEIKTL